jgi:hypothetical protein
VGVGVLLWELGMYKVTSKESEASTLVKLLRKVTRADMKTWWERFLKEIFE